MATHQQIFVKNSIAKAIKLLDSFSVSKNALGSELNVKRLINARTQLHKIIKTGGFDISSKSHNIFKIKIDKKKK